MFHSGWLLLAAVLANNGERAKMTDGPGEFDRRRLESFLERVGFSRLEQVSGIDGVVADWSILLTVLSTQLHKRFSHADVHAWDAGLVDADWTWDVTGGQVLVSIAVSGAGFKSIHQRLFTRATETTMVEIPYGPGPENLGDFAVRHKVSAADAILWAYRNVFVRVDAYAPGLDAEPIARTIQGFMDKHHVARVAEHLPRADRVDASAKSVHVGEEWRLSVALGRNTPIAAVSIEFHEEYREPVGYRLDDLHSSGLDATFRARSVGTARVQIQIVDKKTLLSPPLSASVEILPVR